MIQYNKIGFQKLQTQKKIETLVNNDELELLAHGIDRNVFLLNKDFIVKVADIVYTKTNDNDSDSYSDSDNYYYNYITCSNSSSVYNQNYNQNYREWMRWQEMTNIQRSLCAEVVAYWKMNGRSYLVCQNMGNDKYNAIKQEYGGYAGNKASAEYNYFSRLVLERALLVLDLHSGNVSIGNKVLDFGYVADNDDFDNWKEIRENKYYNYPTFCTFVLEKRKKNCYNKLSRKRKGSDEVC